MFLKEKISVSQVRKKQFIKIINWKEYKCYSIFYPVGNGRFNIDKSIEDILWIRENILNSWKNFNNQLANFSYFLLTLSCYLIIILSYKGDQYEIY